MKNVINLDKERRRKDKKIAISRLRDALKRSIVADLRMTFGNRVIESRMGEIDTQIDAIVEEHFLGKKSGQASKGKQRGKE